MSTTQKKIHQEIMFYTYPKLYKGVEWYVGFQAYDPALGKMRRKKIKVNFIEKIAERRRYADGLIRRIISNLDKGWNPWVESENSKAYHMWADVLSHYRKFLSKMVSDGVYREDTYTSYSSYLRVLERYNLERSIPITYVYQFNEDFITEFIEHVYIDRENSVQTRNNYLAYIRTLCTWLLQNRYLKTNPSDGISNISRRKIKKSRTIISENDMVRLHDFLNAKNRHYLLMCYLLHYCFIRPKEISFIKLSDFNIKSQTLFISSDNSKNRKDGVITVPAKVLSLMVDLDIFQNPSDYYLFSDHFMPGVNHRDSKLYRDYWSRVVRPALKYPPHYKLYSLKDTGITNMLRKYDTLTVRDQARHSDILMTDIYTPHDLQMANDLIKNHVGTF